jgi:hypothetical protein
MKRSGHCDEDHNDRRPRGLLYATQTVHKTNWNDHWKDTNDWSNYEYRIYCDAQWIRNLNKCHVQRHRELSPCSYSTIITHLNEYLINWVDLCLQKRHDTPAPPAKFPITFQPLNFLINRIIKACINSAMISNSFIISHCLYYMSLLLQPFLCVPLRRWIGIWVKFIDTM